MNVPASQDAEDTRLIQTIEQAMGGSVTSLTRLSRWRPGWTADVERGGETIPIYVRGERGAGLHTQPLEREYEVLKLLAREGVSVPKVYGWSADPKAILMERIDADPYAGAAGGGPRIREALADYMTKLAAVHRIGSSTASKAIGLPVPRDSEDIALTYFAKAEHAYEAGKIGPDALVEFVRGWVRRNIPMHRTHTTLVISDVPQFFHRDGRVLAIFDLELAQIGDPMMDLASMRLRDTMEPTDRLGELFAAYAEAAGEPVDRQALSFYTVLLSMCVSMIAAPTLHTTSPHPAYVEYLSWCLSTTRSTTLALAEYMGFTLDPVEPLAPAPSPHDTAMADLLVHAAALPPAEGHFREPPIVSLARYAQRAAALGPAIERSERDEAEALLGRPFASSAEAEEALELFVLSAPPAMDETLTRFFHRRETRRLQLLEGYPSPIVVRGVAPLDSEA